MYEVFAIFCAIGFFVAFIYTIDVFTKDGIHNAYVVIISLVVAMILYFIVDSHIEPHNFTMENIKIETDTLDLKGTQYQVFLPHNMEVKLEKYELSLSESWDYTIYKIFIDSVNYIEIRNEMYDSLDAKPEQLEIEE